MFIFESFKMKLRRVSVQGFPKQRSLAISSWSHICPYICIVMPIQNCASCLVVFRTHYWIHSPKFQQTACSLKRDGPSLMETTGSVFIPPNTLQENPDFSSLSLVTVNIRMSEESVVEGLVYQRI
jgi:hypothetical protein